MYTYKELEKQLGSNLGVYLKERQITFKEYQKQENEKMQNMIKAIKNNGGN